MLIHFLRFVFVFLFFHPFGKSRGRLVVVTTPPPPPLLSFSFQPFASAGPSPRPRLIQPLLLPHIPHIPPNWKKKRCMEHLCCCSRDSLTVIHAYHSGRLGVAFPHSFRPFLLLLLSGGGGISSDSLSLSFSLDSSKEHVELFERGGPSHSNVAKRCCCYVPRRCRHVEIFGFFPHFFSPLVVLYQFPYKVASK